MKTYIVQKAIDALDELSRDGTLRDRVANAWAHLGGYGDSHWLEDAEDVKDAYVRAEAAQIGGDLQEESQAIQSIITRVFIESGYAKAIAEQNSN